MDLLKKSITIVCLVSIFLLIGSVNQAVIHSASKMKHIIIIKSHDNFMYSQVEQSFRQTFGQAARFKVCIVDNVNIQETIDKYCPDVLDFDLIFTLGTKAAKMVLEQIHTIPVIAGLIVRPDILKTHSNATGVYLEFSIDRQLFWIQKIFGKDSRVGVIYNPVENQLSIEQLEQKARDWDCRIESKAVFRPQELPLALKHMTNRANLLLGIQDKIVLNSKTARQLLLFSFRNRIPFVAPSGNWVKAGALYALDWDFNDLGLQCGQMAQSILNGKPVKALPPQEPRKEKLVFNLKTARHMKLTIPTIIFKEAIQFIEEK